MPPKMRRSSPPGVCPLPPPPLRLPPPPTSTACPPLPRQAGATGQPRASFIIFWRQGSSTMRAAALCAALLLAVAGAWVASLQVQTDWHKAGAQRHRHFITPPPHSFLCFGACNAAAPAAGQPCKVADGCSACTVAVPSGGAGSMCVACKPGFSLVVRGGGEGAGQQTAVRRHGACTACRWARRLFGGLAASSSGGVALAHLLQQCQPRHVHPAPTPRFPPARQDSVQGWKVHQRGRVVHQGAQLAGAFDRWWRRPAGGQLRGACKGTGACVSLARTVRRRRRRAGGRPSSSSPPHSRAPPATLPLAAGCVAPRVHRGGRRLCGMQRRAQQVHGVRHGLGLPAAAQRHVPAVQHPGRVLRGPRQLPVQEGAGCCAALRRAAPRRVEGAWRVRCAARVAVVCGRCAKLAWVQTPLAPLSLQFVQGEKGECSVAFKASHARLLRQPWHGAAHADRRRASPSSIPATPCSVPRPTVPLALAPMDPTVSLARMDMC